MNTSIVRLTALGILATAIAFSSFASQQDSSASYNFRVLLDDKPIGSHEFKLSQDNAVKEVSSTARFDVKLLFITAFKYRHSSSERWKDGCLQDMEAQTNSNGKQQNVSAERVDDALRIDSSSGTRKVDGCVKSFAYWDPSILDASRLLNAQTGDYIDVEVTALGADTVKVGGSEFDAKKFKLTSAPDYEGKPVDITLWYDQSVKHWLALESVAKGDRTLRYERKDPPALDGSSPPDTNASARR